MPLKIIEVKSQIPNPKSQTNPKSQIPNPKRSKFWSLVIWSLVIVCNLVLGAWNFMPCYAAPSYGTKMPLKKQFFLGAQTHMVFKRYLKDEQGKLRSVQNLTLLSYGVYDWLSIDLKAGSGNIKQHPVGSDEIDYSSRFAGGYGFRLRLYQKDNLKAVFGFQHVSVHPRKTHLGNVKHQAVLDDWQFSLLTSYDLKKIIPYLGTRWSRMDYIQWTDESRKRLKSDLTKDIGLIVGLDLPLVKNFWINLEGNFLDSEAVAFSLNYSF